MNNLELKKSEKKIEYALYSGVILIILSFTMACLGESNSYFAAKHGYTIWAFVETTILAILTFGFYKQNRFFALSLLIYTILATFLMVFFSENLNVITLTISAVFVYFFFQGTRATFNIHKHKINKG